MTEQERIYRIAEDRIEVDVGERVVVCDGEANRFIRPKEFDVLALLASQPDRVISYSDIYKNIWGYDDERGNALHVTVSTLRRNLREELGDPKYGAIRTKRHLGYAAVSSLVEHMPIDADSLQWHRIADNRVEVCANERIIIVDGRPMDDVPPVPFRLLAHLAREPNKVIGIEALCLEEWGAFDKSILQYAHVGIYTVRKKLGRELGDIKKGAIRNHRGVGYYAVKNLDYKIY